ncbi:hypothetical protein D3C80_961460 [compost metagenome]
MGDQQADTLGKRCHVAGQDHRVRRTGVDCQQCLVEAAIFLGLGEGLDELQINQRATWRLGFAAFLRADEADEFEAHETKLLVWVGSGNRCLAAAQGVAVFWHAEAEIVAQGFTGVLTAHQATGLQQRHHVIGEVLQAVR